MRLNDLTKIPGMKVVTRGDQKFTMKLEKDELTRGRYRVTLHDGESSVGYCALKPARNRFTSGFRITNYSVFGARRLRLGQEMIRFFEAETGKVVIPSGLFGAQGQLTQDGKRAAIQRLEADQPSWLPDDWRSYLGHAKMVEAFVHYDDNREHIKAAAKVCQKVKDMASGQPIRIDLRPEIVYNNCHGIVLTGSGFGTPLMKYLLQLADEAGMNVYTDAEGPRSYDFYTRLGFSKDRTGRHQLVWYPDPGEEYAYLYETKLTQLSRSQVERLKPEKVGDDWYAMLGNSGYAPSATREELLDTINAIRGQHELPESRAVQNFAPELDEEGLIAFAWGCVHEDEIDEVSEHFMNEMFEGASAVMKSIPIAGLKLNGGVEVGYKTKQYRKLTTEAPPIIVNRYTKEVMDGNHRLREALRRGQTEILAYVVSWDEEPL